MMTKTWQQNLVDQHPELFIRTYRGVPFSPGYPVAGDGWREIVTSLVERVSAAAEGYPIHFVQICERHGRLRVHWKAEANVPKRLEHTIEEAVTRAEARSIYSCLACGAKARLFSSGGRLIPSCPDHARGVPVPVRTAIEGLHIFQRRVDDSSTISCVRYDWDHDQFVDADPNLVGVDDWHALLDLAVRLA
jgi:hypothetical protein